MQSLGNVSHKLASRSISKNTRKLDLQLLLNLKLFHIHMKMKFGVLGVAGKLVKDVIQLWWWNFEKRVVFSFYKLSKQLISKFWFQEINKNHDFSSSNKQGVTLE
jgi:hypothetical protein